MPRTRSAIAPDWWDYTTLDAALLADAARLTPDDLRQLSRPGFRVVFYDTLEEFYLAEALEYITAWTAATADAPVGICGPIGPTEQLPLVARLVNELGLSLRHAHFWGMDEWVVDGREVPATHPSVVREGRPRAVLRSHPPRAAHARRQPPLPEGRHHGVPPKLGRRCALRRDAGWTGRRQALGLQRPADGARGSYRRRAADAGRVPRACRRAWWICIR